MDNKENIALAKELLNNTRPTTLRETEPGLYSETELLQEVLNGRVQMEHLFFTEALTCLAESSIMADGLFIQGVCDSRIGGNKNISGYLVLFGRVRPEGAGEYFNIEVIPTKEGYQSSIYTN